ncbi:glycine--tRNA ligase subunit beta [Marinicella sediminis]|uniref:Glycine--tRNA ligase beta subunit n=1 Tax=Marinicella sediminis TaxID=1792834 RepID=A0ABV7JBH6_9GAMM|nr:glycine--tRNA ligase subunit beta [Marinicella sediminis]
MADILFELGCEELPPKALYGLAEALYQGVCRQMDEAGFSYAGDSRWFASPRRLAFLLKGVTEQLADQHIEKRGPAVAAAFDEDGNPKPAAMGFARSLGVDIADLSRVETEKGDYLTYQVTEAGQHIAAVMPQYIAKAIKQLPIPKPMRWGDHEYSFIRPVHWMVLLKDQDVIPMELFGVTTGQQSLGHRFHHNEFVSIDKPADYVSVMQQAGIMVDQQQREQLIAEQVKAAAHSVNGVARIEAGLLSEVASITEKPSAVLGEFNKDFLSVPKEALISSMEKHQKYFPVEDQQGQLMPYFVALANIDSSNPEAVKKGFEKVITPRLADARFFWEKDKARPLEDNIPLLEKMVFEQSLGTLADKTNRISQLLVWMSPQLGFEETDAKQVARLMKCDLMSDMVDEFPDLQGLMGGYYAAEQQESEAVSMAIRDQYLPRFVGDDLPATRLGQAVSMADKMDTLCGIFAVGKKPTGSKDPFALRRATLSIINILIEQQLTINPRELMWTAFAALPVTVDEAVKQEVLDFFNERLRHQYQGQGISHDVVNAVLAKHPDNLVDFDQRVRATELFKQQPFAKSLIEANKRALNITKKSNVDLPVDIHAHRVDATLFTQEQEQQVYEQLAAIEPQLGELVTRFAYDQAFEVLSSLAQPLDDYFEHVMVNADDQQVKINRLTQLVQVSRLTGSIADLSKLVKS